MFHISFVPLFTFFTFSVLATHNHGSYIAVAVNSGNNCQIEIVTLTASNNPTDRDSIQLTISYNGTPIDTPMVDRTKAMDVDDHYRRNYYIMDYSFPGPGHYTLSMTDPNLAVGIQNVTNSVNVPMYVETEIFLGPAFTQTARFDSFYQRPVAVNKDTFFYHLQPDAGSQQVKFSRVTPLQGEGATVPGYQDMNASVDEKSGLFHLPLHSTGPGYYLFAAQIETYHQGQLTSRMHRSFLVELHDHPLSAQFAVLKGLPEDTLANRYAILIPPGQSDTIEVEWSDHDVANAQTLDAFSYDLEVHKENLMQNDTIHHAQFILEVQPGQKQAMPYFVTIRGSASFVEPGDTTGFLHSEDLAILVYTEPISGTHDPHFTELTLYPNPVRDVLRISGSESNNLQYYQIYNPNGRVVQSGRIHNSGIIKVNRLAAGVYFLKSMNSEKKWSRAQFVKE